MTIYAISDEPKWGSDGAFFKGETTAEIDTQIKETFDNWGGGFDIEQESSDLKYYYSDDASTDLRDSLFDDLSQTDVQSLRAEIGDNPDSFFRDAEFEAEGGRRFRIWQHPLNDNPNEIIVEKLSSKSFGYIICVCEIGTFIELLGS